MSLDSVVVIRFSWAVLGSEWANFIGADLLFLSESELSLRAMSMAGGGMNDVVYPALFVNPNHRSHLRAG